MKNTNAYKIYKGGVMAHPSAQHIAAGNWKQAAKATALGKMASAAKGHAGDYGEVSVVRKAMGHRLALAAIRASSGHGAKTGAASSRRA